MSFCVKGEADGRCKGMVESLERQGYTVLFARDDWSYIWHLYRQIPDMVKVILANDQGSGGKPADFFKSDARPDGIPAWKVSSCGRVELGVPLG